jgi:N-acylneuraminate cytidylyltransferase
MRIVGFVPLRGGSKSIPLKNIKKIAGKPLFYWAVSSAVESNVFDEIIVSTDSEEVKKSVLSYIPDVRVIDRPSELSTDTSKTEEAMLHFAENDPFDIISLIQVTSPLTSKQDFIEASKCFTEGDYDSLLSAVKSNRFYWDGAGRPLNYDPVARPMRQQMGDTFLENGAFYFTKRDILLQQKSRLGGKIGLFEMHPDTAVEIDEKEDWDIVESLILNNRKHVHSEKIAAVFVDVDGTLTDGGMYYTADGEKMKKFNTKDAVGLKLLTDKGLRVCIITAEVSPSVEVRMKKLGIKDYYPGVKDKLPLMKKLCSDWGIALSKAGYIGDDYGDVECIQEAGFSACPADGENCVKDDVHFVSRFKGGDGAVREICEYIVQYLT